MKEQREFDVQLETPELGPQVLEWGWRYFEGERRPGSPDFIVQGRVVLSCERPEVSYEDFASARDLLRAAGRGLIENSGLQWLP